MTSHISHLTQFASGREREKTMYPISSNITKSHHPHINKSNIEKAARLGNRTA